MNKTKVLYVVNDLSVGGVTNILISTLNYFDYDRFDVDLLVLSNSNPDGFKNIPKNINVIKGDSFFGINSYRMKDLIKEKEIKKILSKLVFAFLIKSGLIIRKIRKNREKLLFKKYDCEIAFSDGFATLFTAFGETNNKLCWFHSDYNVCNYSSKYIRIFKNALVKFDEVIGVSEEVADSVKNIFSLKKKPLVILNIQDFDKIKELSNKKMEFDYDNKATNLISVGRLEKQKSYLRYVDVHKKLVDDGFNINFYLIGDGSKYMEIKNKVNLLNLDSTFNLLGYKNNPYPYIKNADLFILTSIYEGMPTVVFESLALQTPVLSTRVAGIDYLLGEKKYGIIVENSFDGIYKGLKELLTKQNKIKEFKDNLKNYDLTNEDSFEKIYFLIERYKETSYGTV